MTELQRPTFDTQKRVWNLEGKYTTLTRKFFEGARADTDVDDSQEDNRRAFSEINVDLLKDHALSVLEAEGYIEKYEDGVYICDLEKLRGELHFSHRLSKLLGPIATDARFGNNKLFDTFFFLFKNVKVLSKEDGAKAKSGETIDSRKLFYFPKNEKDAFDAGAIKQNKGYLGLWDFGGPNNSTIKRFESHYPTDEDGLNSELEVMQATIAGLVYHRDYGDAYRDAEGVLWVKPRINEGEHKPISSTFFADWGVGVRAGGIAASPVAFLRNLCPDLLKSGLLLESDFMAVTNDSIVHARSTDKRGRIAFGGLKYNLAALVPDGVAKDEFYRQLKLYKISADKVVVVQQKPDGESVMINILKLESIDSEKIKRIATDRKSPYPLDKSSPYSLRSEDSAYEFAPDGVITQKLRAGDMKPAVEYFLSLPAKQQKALFPSLINFADLGQLIFTFQEYLSEGSGSKRDNAEKWLRVLTAVDQDKPVHTIQTAYGKPGNSQVDLEQAEIVSAYNHAGEVSRISEWLTRGDIGGEGLVIDVGCGTGNVSEMLLNHLKKDSPDAIEGFRFHAFDLSEENISRAQEKLSGYGVGVERASWLDTPYEDGDAALVFCVGRSIHHLKNAAEARLFFDEQFRVLKDGGLLMLDALDPTTGIYQKKRRELIRGLEEGGLRLLARFGEKAREDDYIEQVPFLVDGPFGDKVNRLCRFTPKIGFWIDMAHKAGFELAEMPSGSSDAGKKAMYPEKIFPQDPEENAMNTTLVFRKKTSMIPL